jgi:hypothetical protein
MAGELGGLVAGSVATGGKGLGALGHVAEALVPKALGRVGTGVARGAAEGTALGGISALNEAALNESHLGPPEDLGEKIVAGMGHGAFMGAGLGGAFSGLGVIAGQARDAGGRYLAKLRAPDVEALAEKTFGYAPEGLGERVQKFYARTSAGVSGKDAEVIDRLTSLSREGAEARRIAVYDAPKMQDEAQRAVREHVDTLLRSGDLVSAEARGSLKRDYVAKAVKVGNEAETSAFAKSQLERLIAGAEGQLTHADGIAPQMVKSVETLSKAAYRAADALEAGDNGVLFVELDNLKRSVQKLANTGYRSVPNIADPLDQMAARRTVDWFRSAAEDLRAGLEDEGLWGKAAADQRSINAAWTKQIDASQRFHRALTTETGRDPSNPYVRQRGADPAKVEGYVRNLTNPTNDLTHAAVKDFVGGTRELADAISKSYDLPPEKLAEVARVRAAAEAFEGTVTKAEKGLVLANQYRALTEGTTDSLAATLGTVGGIVGGLPGGVVGAAMGSLANPGRVVAQLAAIERLGMKVDTRIDSSLRGFFRGSSRAARPAELHEAATPEGFQAKVKQLAENVDVDGNMTPLGERRIADALGDLYASAPNAATAATLTATRVAQFLASKVPAGLQNPSDLWIGDEPPLVSDTERETFARYVKAAEDPASVMEHLARGDITPEEVDALKFCYPRIYTQAQAKLDAMVERAAGAKKPLPYAERVTLGVLLERPTDATMDRQVLAMVAYAQAQQGRRGSGGARSQQSGGMSAPPRLRSAPGFSARFQTTSEAAASRRKGGLL